MDFINHLRETLPPFFPATQLDELTSGILCWRTVQNNRRSYPEACFSKISPKKTVICRDCFLDYISSHIPKFSHRG